MEVIEERICKRSDLSTSQPVGRADFLHGFVKRQRFLEIIGAFRCNLSERFVEPRGAADLIACIRT